MQKTKVYELEFKKKIIQLYLEQGHMIKRLNKEYQLCDETLRICCGQNMPEPCIYIKIYAEIGHPIHGNAEKASI